MTYVIGSDADRKSPVGSRVFCGLRTDRPGQEWNDFVHGTDELLMMVEGELGLEMQGGTWNPKSGAEILTGGQDHTLVVWV